MAVMTFTVANTIPVMVWPSGKATDILVRNTGTANTVKLGDINSGAGLTLGPGSSMIWNAGVPLFASMTASAVSTTIDIIDNGGNLFDASAVAAQITISGAPPVNVHDNIADITFANGNGVSSVIDISKYQSIMICAFEYRGSSTTVPAPRNISLLWETAAGFSMYQDDFHLSDNNGQGNQDTRGMVVIAPVKAVRLQIVAASTARTQNVHIMVMGTYKTAMGTTYFMDSGYASVSTATKFGTGYDNLYAMQNTLTASLTISEYPPVKSGLVVMTARSNAVVTAGSVSFLLTEATNLFPIHTIRMDATTVANNLSQVVQLLVPYRGLRMSIVTDAAFTPITAVGSFALNFIQNA